MADGFPIGKNSFVDYVLIFSGKKYWAWEIKGVRSHVDLAAQGPQIKQLFQKDVKILGEDKAADQSLQYFHPCYLFMGEQNAIESLSNSNQNDGSGAAQS